MVNPLQRVSAISLAFQRQAPHVDEQRTIRYNTTAWDKIRLHAV
ncbi:MAG: hypothetical protein R3C14_54560 [Caldilineaceae bacterium]